MGFFITTIQLNNDSTLKYNFNGDLINRSATGHYHRKGDTLLLYYMWNKDNSENMLAGATNDEMQLHFDEDTLQYRGRYIVGHNKLFPMHLKTGRKLTRDVRYNKRRKYILYGSHYYKKRFFLKRTH